ncbi:MAG TPA: ABC transporter permease [Bacteroidota bacterium]|nr:ABC transporter permease [Bacteroidota bacterium]
MNTLSFLEIMQREWRRILADKNILLVVMLAPLAYLLIFGFEYAQRKVYDLPLVVVDYDASPLSRTIIRDLDANEAIRVTEVVHDDNGLREKFLSESCWAAVVLPPHLERDVKHGEHVNVLMLVNSADILIYDYAATGVQSVLGTVGAGVSIEKMMKSGTSAIAVRSSYLPLSFENRVAFNPALTYSNFILPLLFMILLHQVLALAGGMSWAGEWEAGNGGLSALPLLYRSKFIIAKAMPYAAIALAWIAVIVFGAHPLLGVPFVGSAVALTVFWLLFSVNVALLGALVGSLIASRVGVVQILFLYSMPALLISGTVWPLSAMPTPVEWLAFLLPSTHILTAYRQIALEGAGLAILAPSFLWLTATAAGLMVVVSLVVRRKATKGQVVVG